MHWSHSEPRLWLLTLGDNYQSVNMLLTKQRAETRASFIEVCKEPHKGRESKCDVLGLQVRGAVGLGQNCPRTTLLLWPHPVLSPDGNAQRHIHFVPCWP